MSYATKYCNNVIMMSVSRRKKINKQIKIMKKLLPDMKHIIANMNVKL